MDSEIAVHELSSIRTEAGSLLDYALTHKPNRQLLNFNRLGVANLFNEFNRVGGECDYLQESFANLELRKSAVAGWLKGEEALLEKKVREEMHKKLPQWVGSGYAAEERRILATLNSGGDHKLRVVKISLETTESVLALLQNRVKMFADFKFDARLMQAMLNFGHALQELT